MDKEDSKVPIYRHSDKISNDFSPVSGDSDIQLISQHIEKYLGNIDSVFHEVVSEIVHVDIHYIKPSDRLPFHIFVTSGMSDKPMNVPQGMGEHSFAELLVLLPSNWPMKMENYKLQNEIFVDSNSSWPIDWLKIVTRFPHVYNTWIGWGHTIPNGEKAEPFADNTELGCMLVLPSISLPRDFIELRINENKNIKFYCLYPLFPEEMEYRLKQGTSKLLDKFDKYKIRDVIDINRPNTCAKKGIFGLW